MSAKNNNEINLEVFILPVLAVVAVVCLTITSFSFSKDKTEIRQALQIPELKDHTIRLIRPDGTVDKTTTVKNYENNLKVLANESGNLYVSDFNQGYYEYVAPIGWNIEVVDIEEE